VSLVLHHTEELIRILCFSQQWKN